MVEGRSERVRNVLVDFLQHLRPQIRRCMTAICTAGAGEVVTISCILVELKDSDFIENVADCHNFTTFGNADGRHISPDFCSKVLYEVREDAVHLS